MNLTRSNAESRVCVPEFDVFPEQETHRENIENEVPEDPMGQWVTKYTNVSINQKNDILLRYPETIQERTKRTKGYKRVQFQLPLLVFKWLTLFIKEIRQCKDKCGFKLDIHYHSDTQNISVLCMDLQKHFDQVNSILMYISYF
jgi:hypothetical protein